MLIGLLSAKGSPGVTASAVAMTAVVGIDSLLVEFDPSGGSVECWTGAAGEPGLVRVASALRRSITPEALTTGTVQTPPGVSSILAPTVGPLAESAVAAIGERIAGPAHATGRVVLLDCGRWARSQTTARRITGCDALVVVCHPTLAGIETARALVDSLDAAVESTVSLLLVGDRPYREREVTDATGIPVAGALPWDARSINELFLNGPSKGWLRTGLARAAKATLATVMESVPTLQEAVA